MFALFPSTKTSALRLLSLASLGLRSGKEGIGTEARKEKKLKGQGSCVDTTPFEHPNQILELIFSGVLSFALRYAKLY